MKPRFLLLCLAAMSVGMALSAAPMPKGKPVTEIISGKVTSVERKGKAATLKVETAAGDNIDVLVTPKTNFAVTAKSDKSLFRPGVWVSCEHIVMNEANKLFFSKEFLVHVGAPPAPLVAKNMNNGWDVCGQLASVAEDSITLKPSTKIMFDEGVCNVTVRSNDTSLVEVGIAIDLEGTRRGEKFLPTKVSIALDKTLTDAEVFPAKGKARKTTAKTGKDADKPADGSADPFASKSGAKSSTDKPAESANPFGKKPESQPPPPKSADPFKDKPKDAPKLDEPRKTAGK